MKLLACTPAPDLIAGAATRGCQSRKGVTELLRLGEEKLRKTLKAAVGRGHYSVLEHNRMLWLVEGVPEREILRQCLGYKFLEISKLGEDSWILSANLRTVLELAQSGGNELINKLVESVRSVSSTFAELVDSHESKTFGPRSR